MKPIDKKKKADQSLFAELFFGIIGLFLGDITSKIGWAFIFLVIGILFLVRPLVDLDGAEINKDAVHYVVSSVFLLLSVILIISWVRKRKSK